MANFPLTMPFSSPGYATYIPGRHPEFKAHAHRGLAKSAFKDKMWNPTRDSKERVFPHMALYKLYVDDAGNAYWALDVEIAPGSKPSDYPELWPTG